VAAATGMLAYATRPIPPVVRIDEEVGHDLFREFNDPSQAASLRIVSPNDGLDRTNSFEVARKAGQWVIPSHNDYPADAENQMRDVASGFVGLKVLRVEDAKPADHELYGVVEPDPNATESSGKGRGTLVEFADESRKPMARLIIGKEVKDAEGQRYARVPGRDRVYIVKIDPKKFTTKFEDWVEKDLLKISNFDVTKLTLKDYSVELGRTPQGLGIKSFDQRFELSVRDDSTQNKWVLESFRETRDGKLQDAQLGETEELSKTGLDGLKNSLSELKIVDVERKPAGLGADLKADKGFLEDQQGVGSLVDKGFYPVEIRDRVDLLCSNGEVQVRTKDGIEYLLRFGEIASVNQEEESAQKGSVNRWLFVTANIDQTQFPDPVLEPVPDLPGETSTKSAASEGDPLSPPAAPDAAATNPNPTENETPGSTENATETTNATEAAESGADSSAEKPPGDEKELSADEAKEKIRKEQDRITKENQRKLDEHKQKLDKAKQKVAEVNFRFADWYYIISDDVYRKIHLGRSDVITLSDSAQKEGTGLEAFRKLQDQVEGTDPPSEPAPPIP